MFFDGCPPHLGCSIKLRGSSEYELARVKEIIMLMVCVAYHSQLEISFLMDEFAMPPSLPQSSSFPCLLDMSPADQETDQHSLEKTVGSEEEAHSVEPASKNGDVDVLQEQSNRPSPPIFFQEDASNTEIRTSSPYSSLGAAPLSGSLPVLMEDNQELGSDTLVGISEGDTMGDSSMDIENEDCSETPTPKLFRDPLQDDTGMFVAEQVDSSDDRLKSISAVFKHELKDVILCISPFITFREPFLLTPEGIHCPSRDYFPEQVPLQSCHHHVCVRTAPAVRTHKEMFTNLISIKCKT